MRLISIISEVVVTHKNCMILINGIIFIFQQRSQNEKQTKIQLEYERQHEKL